MKYLNFLEPWIIKENFNVCLRICEGEPIAFERARQYLESPDPFRIFENFTTCLEILKSEPIAIEKARQYLESPYALEVTENYATCLRVLGERGADIAEKILRSDYGKVKHRIIYQALQIAAKTSDLDDIAESAVMSILNHLPQYHVKNDRQERDAYHFYLQVMKVPLFRLQSWRNEVNRQLSNYRTIHRNLFYSLTLSHIDCPGVLENACIYFIKNWKSEFERPKIKWGYFIRCLAHPKIQEQPKLREEVRSLCRNMLNAIKAPKEIKDWLNSIVLNDIFPQWNSAEKED
jgi:hypothetical protein